MSDKKEPVPPPEELPEITGAMEVTDEGDDFAPKPKPDPVEEKS